VIRVAGAAFPGDAVILFAGSAAEKSDPIRFESSEKAIFGSGLVREIPGRF